MSIDIFDANGNFKKIATDTIGGTDFQEEKIIWGGTGVANDTDQTTPLPVQLTANASAEGSTPHNNTTASITPITVSTSPGVLFQITMDNLDGGDDAFVRLYDEASVIVASSIPVSIFRIKANDQFTWQSPVGIKFGTAIRYAVTKELSGPFTSPTTPLIINAEFKGG